MEYTSQCSGMPYLVPGGCTGTKENKMERVAIPGPGADSIALPGIGVYNSNSNSNNIMVICIILGVWLWGF